MCSCMHFYGMLLAQSNRKASRLQLHHSPQAAMADKKRKPDTDVHFYATTHYRCKICKELFDGINQARDHVATHDATLRANLDEYRRPCPTVSCDQCNKQFKDTPAGRAQLSKHQVCCGDTETICSRCGCDFKKPQCYGATWYRIHVAFGRGGQMSAS